MSGQKQKHGQSKGKQDNLTVGDLVDLYQEQAPVVKRFLKYGGWIAVQFWLLRAPMTWWMVSVLPAQLNLLIVTIPSYLLADFLAGTILAVAGFFVSEYGIWKGKD